MWIAWGKVGRGTRELLYVIDGLNMQSTTDKLKALGIESTEKISFTVKEENQMREAYNILNEDGWGIIESNRGLITAIRFIKK